jgi:hypothetical protein
LRDVGLTEAGPLPYLDLRHARKAHRVTETVRGRLRIGPQLSELCVGQHCKAEYMPTL